MTRIPVANVSFPIVLTTSLSSSTDFLHSSPCSLFENLQSPDLESSIAPPKEKLLIASLYAACSVSLKTPFDTHLTIAHISRVSRSCFYHHSVAYRGSWMPEANEVLGCPGQGKSLHILK